MNALLLFASVLIGAGLGLFLYRKQRQLIKYLLAFSGAYLFGISIVHLFPEIFEHNISNAGLWILVGFFAQIVLEYFSKGLEHGHLHIHETGNRAVLMVSALWVHAFLEGMPLGGHAHIHPGLEAFDPLLAGVLMHKIPIGMIVMILLLELKISNLLRGVALLTFAIAAPLGSILAAEIALIHDSAGILMAFVLGMFLHISTTILFESSDSHKFNRSKLAVVLIGALLAYLTAG